MFDNWFQGSLLDLAEWDNSHGLRPLSGAVERRELSEGAWVDLRRGWVTGADDLFARLLADVPWRAERRVMYERVVDVPRLLCFYGEGEPLPDPGPRHRPAPPLDAHYAAELGEPFVTAGLCLYRDGRDSVAWHGDTFGRGSTEDTMVAILSLGTPRTLALRPRGGGDPQATLRYEVGHGDLLVMGGTCQRTWEHSVPKSTRIAGRPDQRPVPDLGSDGSGSGAHENANGTISSEMVPMIRVGDTGIEPVTPAV